MNLSLELKSSDGTLLRPPNATANFQAYLNYVYKLPILSEQEEKELFKRYQLLDDLQAVRDIIQSHLRFVAHIAHGYSGYGLPLEDLVQEGSVGLMKSIKRFDLSVGARFASFAIHWIKAEIYEYVIKNWRLVQVATTKAQRKLFFKLRNLKKKLGWMNDEEKQEVADYLKVDIKDVSTMEERLHQYDAYFDESFGDARVEDRDSSSATAKYLEDKQWAPEAALVEQNSYQQYQTLLTSGLDKLNKRELEIINSRWLCGSKTQKKLIDLAKQFSISSERVRQIEQSALSKIRQHMQANKFDIEELRELIE